MASFLEALGENLANRWAGVAVPALIFWGAGFAAFLSSHGGTDEWTDLTERFENLRGTTQILIAAALLIGVALSATVVQWLAKPALRALRGEWSWLARIQRLFDWRRHSRYAKNQARLEELLTRDFREWSSDDYREWQVRDRASRLMLAKEDRTPTRLGDLMRAYEWWPETKYGLAPDVCLPRLWLILPATSRDELRTARAQLNGAVAAWVWAVLFIGWTPWSWWAPLVSVGVASGVYYGWILIAAVNYEDLMESSFDVHRRDLYDAMEWTKPDKLSDEPSVGRELTHYLARGPDLPVSEPAKGDEATQDS